MLPRFLNWMFGRRKQNAAGTSLPQKNLVSDNLTATRLRHARRRRQDEDAPLPQGATGPADEIRQPAAAQPARTRNTRRQTVRDGLGADARETGSASDTSLPEHTDYPAAERPRAAGRRRKRAEPIGTSSGTASDSAPLPEHVHSAQALGISRDAVSAAALRTCEGLQQAGYTAYIVGGGVRDMLLGIPPKDFDVATDASPEAVESIFRRSRIIGRRFRIVHVMFGRETIEVTTFRAAQTNALTDEHGRMLNDNVFGTRDEDASRRDFTVNALYYDPISETLIDPLDGVKDIRARVLRMIGDPETRYREDPVRMLRTVRFAAKLGFDVDPPTLEPIRTLAPLLENVPPARLFDEILKLLESGHGLACIRRLRHEGLHHGVLPLLDTLFETDEHFITEALSRTDARVREDKSVSPSFLFAALLWPQVRVRWQEIHAKGEHLFPALHLAIDSVLDEQAEKLALQRRYQADMREIWVMQPRLEKRGRSAFGVIAHIRFRAGYDFLLLRCAAGELDTAIGDWWTAFIDADRDQRDALIQSLAPTKASGDAKGKSRRRRRRGARREDGEAPADGSAMPEARAASAPDLPPDVAA
ncbi:MAG: polynucleotide adenylyltransferase PcnB [Lautropia sp.]|nr:polynucleotide adenylyltransferase PcnB [Lautropia sp.]